MTALTAMTLPSSAAAAAPASREKQTPAQTDGSQSNDFESSLEHATRPDTVEHRPAGADLEASTDIAVDPQAETDPASQVAPTENWAAQLAYLQTPSTNTTTVMSAQAETSSSPEVDVLESLGKALSQQAEPVAADTADDSDPVFALPLPSETRPTLGKSTVSNRNPIAVLDAGTSSSAIAPDTEAPASALPQDNVRPTELTLPPAGQIAPSAAATRAAEALPQIPGAAMPLQTQALQQRMDEALRWMVGQGVQSAQVRIAPEALGPLTIHLHMHGEQANLAFITGVDATRQALEANLAALKESLSQQGFSLGQAFVGNQEQHEAQQFQQQTQSQQAEGGNRSGLASGTDTSTAPAIPSNSPSRQGLVDVFA